MGPADQPALPTLPLGLPAAAAARCSKAEHLHAAAAAAVRLQPAAAAVFPRKLLLPELFAAAAKLQPTDELFSSK